MHIAIAGNIGSGKTTLTKMLAAHYGWTPKFESVDFNPYLSDFYADMERWSFNLQVYFLNKRFKDVVDISRCSDVIIQDTVGTREGLLRYGTGWRTRLVHRRGFLNISSRIS